MRRTAIARSLHATAAIEGNTLSIDQVGYILDGRAVPSKHPREVIEVQNAARAYARVNYFKPWSLKNFLSAHKIMMAPLLDDVIYVIGDGELEVYVFEVTPHKY